MSQEVVADRHRLRALEVCVSGHQPTSVRSSLGSKSVDNFGDRRHQVRRRKPAEKPQVQRDLVVARATGVQRGPRRCELRKPALDRRVDVFVSFVEFELTLIQLAFDAAEASLYRRQSRPGQQSRGRQAARVRDAAGDVKRVQLEIRLQR